MPIIKLQSSDGELFCLDSKMACCSKTLETMFQNLGIEEEKEGGDVIPLPNVHSDILRKIKEWAEHHQEHPPAPPTQPTEEGYRTVSISAWDEQFFKNVGQDTIFRMMTAANYLDIQELLDVLCCIVKNQMESMSVEQIRQMCHIENDFTLEEEQRLRMENSWCGPRDPDN